MFGAAKLAAYFLLYTSKPLNTLIKKYGHLINTNIAYILLYLFIDACVYADIVN